MISSFSISTKFTGKKNQQQHYASVRDTKFQISIMAHPYHSRSPPQNNGVSSDIDSSPGWIGRESTQPLDRRSYGMMSSPVDSQGDGETLNM